MNAEIAAFAAAAKFPLLAGTVFFSAVAFLCMGRDKANAQAKRSRIPERTLLLFAWCFGGPGAFLGMEFFRHKTKKPPFPTLLPLLALLQSGLVFAAFLLSGG